MNCVFVSLLLLLAFPADGGSAGDAQVRSTLVLGDGETLISSVSGISSDRAGNVYVSDMLDYSVKKFGPRGAFLGKVGRRGAGPGEFRSPALSLVTNGCLIVLQAEDRRVQIFGTDLRYRSVFEVSGGIPVDIAPGPGRRFAVALYSDSSHGTVLQFDGPGNAGPRRIPLAPTGKLHPLFSATRIAVLPDGSLVAAYLFMNRVEIYGSDGRFRRRFSVSSMPAADPGTCSGLIPEETYVRKVIVDDKGEILLLGGNQARHAGRDVFVYRLDGSYLRTIVLPGKTRLIAAGGRNTFYATDESGTRVERFRIR